MNRITKYVIGVILCIALIYLSIALILYNISIREWDGVVRGIFVVFSWIVVLYAPIIYKHTNDNDL